MTTRARSGDGVGVEASMGGPRPRRARRALLKAVLVLLCLGAGAAGRIFGGDWVWAGFAGALMLTAVIVLRGAWQPAPSGAGRGSISAQAAGRDAHMTHNRSFTLNAGGFSAVVGAAFIIVLNGALVAHVSTEVPGGRYYRPENTETVQRKPPATAVEPVFLRDLPEEQIRVSTGGSAPQAGARLAGRQCARSVFMPVSEVGRARLIVLTPSKRYKRFTALAGMPDDEDVRASTEFALLGDDQRVIDHKTVSPGKPAEFDQDVSAYATLYLRVTLITSRNGSEYGGDYRAVWGDAQLLAPNGQARVCPTSA
ncbi:NPCBM/NEW2 domain-containing protein [Actinomadura sp. K4S16]|uniref:NPCBM/NEW2 domain-containing protein n=1 Tax=Actinomadura sp. K4S16 TaxID=1316147 RepID=UPI0011EF04C6|nr:NPCBM/NEW2 domain-containing protein [Actinomadura sp. K4S16]